MLFIFSTPVLIRHLWQLKTVIFLHWCLMHAVLFVGEIHSQGTYQMVCWKIKTNLQTHFHELFKTITFSVNLQKLCSSFWAYDDAVVVAAVLTVLFVVDDEDVVVVVEVGAVSVIAFLSTKFKGKFWQKKLLVINAVCRKIILSLIYA